MQGDSKMIMKRSKLTDATENNLKNKSEVVN